MNCSRYCVKVVRNAGVACFSDYPTPAAALAFARKLLFLCPSRYEQALEKLYGGDSFSYSYGNTGISIMPVFSDIL